MGHRSPLRQHSGMDSDGGVGRGYPKKAGRGVLDWWTAHLCSSFFFSLCLSRALSLSPSLEHSYTLVQYFLLASSV